MGTRVIGLLGAILLSTSVGCGGGSASVTGKVTADGETVDGGDVVFRPVESGVKPAAGVIKKDGTYSLKTAGDEGIWPGEYKLLYTPPDPVERKDGKMGPPSKWRAWQAPDITVKVESGENDIPIELVQP